MNDDVVQIIWVLPYNSVLIKAHLKRYVERILESRNIPELQRVRLMIAWKNDLGNLADKLKRYET